MALNTTRESSSGVFGAIKGALDIFSNINKAKGVSENSNPTPIDEYESTMTEEEIQSLTSQWKHEYATYYAPIDDSQRLSFEYWIGKQKVDESSQVQGVQQLTDNQIFNSIETFLPIATRSNPDPLVKAENSELAQKLAKDLKIVLVKEADRQKLRSKLKRMTRHWILYRLGVMKVSYDVNIDNIATTPINPKRMVFDPEGYIDEAGFFVGDYIGEKKKASASKLMKMFPKKAKEIKEKAYEKKGTKLEYFEWWYKNTDVFYTMEEVVLGKFKNPHWNYNGSVERVDPITQEVTTEEVQGTNFFKERKSPYVFLSIFSTGMQPHDETGLILQNIGIQDLINRRWNQIDKNVDGMNNGMVVSGEMFTEEQASQAAAALRRGTAIRVPTGDVNKAVMRFQPTGLPADVFATLQDARGELSNIFGTSGSTPSGVNKNDTVRGKLLVNQLDSSRIGGGVTEFIEQVADSVYNWWVQMMFVHYTNEHYVNAAGVANGTELIMLKNDRFPMVKSLEITVKEGSLIPKDPLTQRNEAIDLWSAGAIDPKSFYTRLEFSDPDEMAKQLLIWKMVDKGMLPPNFYIPDFPMQPMVPGGDMSQAGNLGGPAVNNIDASNGPAPAPEPQSGEAVQAQSQQLLSSMPV